MYHCLESCRDAARIGLNGFSSEKKLEINIVTERLNYSQNISQVYLIFKIPITAAEDDILNYLFVQRK